VHCALAVHRALAQIASARGAVLDMPAVAVAVNAGARTPAAAPAATSEPASATTVSNRTAPASRSTSAASMATLPPPSRTRHLQAYNLWHHRQLALPAICAAMRASPPLKAATVMCVSVSVSASAAGVLMRRPCSSYVVGALQADARLPFDKARLRGLVLEDAGSWSRHREWLEATGV
jgi:hypothetical protein